MEWNTHEQMYACLMEALKKAGSRQALAAKLDISVGHLNDLIKGNREISSRVANALGYERLKIFVEKSKT